MRRHDTISGRPGQAGLTVVELLIASAILVIVIGSASMFFAQQTQLQRRVQARNLVQDNVRVAMQLVSQDLALAGNSVVINSAGDKDTTVTWPFCFDGGRGCLTIADAGAAVAVRYVSSQFPAADACRDVSYRVDSSTLQRSDVECGEAAVFVDLAPGTTAFTVQVICSTGTVFNVFPDAGCGGGTSYGRSAFVSIAAESVNHVTGTSEAGCAEGHICFAVQQEVLIPNLKDQ